jgi:aminoglycoside 6'-N-acetyltransferase I
MNIVPVSDPDFESWLEMALDLWPYEKPDEMRGILMGLQKETKYENFICKSDIGEPIGFINLSLRSDYVEGSNSSPVAYIEGIYVKPGFRNLGIAKKMVDFAGEWGREKGCAELGSDTELHNTDSQKFHEASGFQKAEVIVSYIRKI